MALVSKCDTSNSLKLSLFFLGSVRFTTLDLFQRTCGQKCVLGAKRWVMTHMCERANGTTGSSVSRLEVARPLNPHRSLVRGSCL